MKNKLLLITTLFTSLVLASCGGGTSSSTTGGSYGPDTSSTGDEESTGTTTSSTGVIETKWPEEVATAMKETLGEVLPEYEDMTNDYDLTEPSYEGDTYLYEDYKTSTKAAEYIGAFANSTWDVSEEEDEDGVYYIISKYLKNDDSGYELAYGYIYDYPGNEQYQYPASFSIEFGVVKASYISEFPDEVKSVIVDFLGEELPFAKGFTENVITSLHASDCVLYVVDDGANEDFVLTYGRALIEAGYELSESDIYYKDCASEKTVDGYKAQIQIELSYDEYFGFVITASLVMRTQQTDAWPTSDVNKALGHEFVDLSSLLTSKCVWMYDKEDFYLETIASSETLIDVLKLLENNDIVISTDENELYSFYYFNSLDGLTSGGICHNKESNVASFIFDLVPGDARTHVTSFPKDAIASLSSQLTEEDIPAISITSGYYSINRSASANHLTLSAFSEQSINDYIEVLTAKEYSITNDDGFYIASKDSSPLMIVFTEVTMAFTGRTFLQIMFIVKVSSVTIDSSSEGMPAKYEDALTAHTVNDLELYTMYVGTSYTAGYIQMKKNSGTILNKTAFDPIGSITLTYKSGSPVCKVSAGTSMDSLTQLTGEVNDDGSVTYLLDGATYFKIEAGSGATYVESIVFTF